MGEMTGCLGKRRESKTGKKKKERKKKGRKKGREGKKTRYFGKKQNK